MKKGFTLIELLVVIAIIAILAAILFPVLAQARLAAKKIVGLNQVKQIGLGMQLYLQDSDDVFFPYRTSDPNPDYTACVASGNANCNTWFGSSTRTRTFFNQLLRPYTKSSDVWKAPTQVNVWEGTDKIGTSSPNFRSYGGQNSYGVNNYAFLQNGMNASSIAEPSNTLIMADASYYNVLPRYVGRLEGTPTGGIDVCSSTYPKYWKSLGNSYLFKWNGTAEVEPSDAEALKLINARYSQVLNIIRADTSAKALRSEFLLNEFRDKGAESMWNPYKSIVTPCP
jgi:prepilin-type N-terminal cleavage/methylation domain-containing protein